MPSYGEYGRLEIMKFCHKINFLAVNWKEAVKLRFVLYT